MADAVPEAVTGKEVGGRSRLQRGRPWACPVQTWLKPETDPGATAGMCSSEPSLLQRVSVRRSFPWLTDSPRCGTAVVNSAAGNIRVHVCVLSHCFQVTWRYTASRSRTAGPKAVRCLTFGGTTKRFPTVAAPFYGPTSIARGFHLPLVLADTSYLFKLQPPEWA